MGKRRKVGEGRHNQEHRNRQADKAASLVPNYGTPTRVFLEPRAQSVLQPKKKEKVFFVGVHDEQPAEVSEWMKRIRNQLFDAGWAESDGSNPSLIAVAICWSPDGKGYLDEGIPTFDLFNEFERKALVVYVNNF